MASTKNLTFQVTRKQPELILAKPTPHEYKPLSDIDDQEGIRFHIRAIQFFPKNPSMEGKDPVSIFRDAIAKALVLYYPFAGRVRELTGGKLVVECTGEGVVFIEADADVTLQQFGENIYPPFPCLEELLYDVPGTTGLIDCPLVLIQVTRLKCGGLVMAIRMNHRMCDGTGLAQFIFTIVEFARGAKAPTIPPVWERHLLTAQTPPRVTTTTHDYGGFPQGTTHFKPGDNWVHRSFPFHAADISALRNSLPPHFHRCTNVELVTACVWRCRTIALSPDPNEEVKLSCFVDMRKRLNPPLPEGYYGNAIVHPSAVTTAGNLSRNPLYYAVELVRKAKAEAMAEYMKLMADPTAVESRPVSTVAGSYLVSDLTKMGFDKIDYGWGKAAYSGMAECSVDTVVGVISFFMPLKDGILAPISLPVKAMEVFTKELDIMLSAARECFSAL